MATQTRLIRFAWENDVGFKMDTKLDDGDWITIVQMDENGHIGSLWPSTQTICETYVKEQVSLIGSEMRA